MPNCAAGHPLKHHLGKRDGPLQCDGPESIECCDGNGVLHPGERRWSCELCDFDICDYCAGETGGAGNERPLAGISQSVKDANFDSLLNQQNLAQAMLGANGQSRSGQGSNTREAYVPRARAAKEDATPALSAAALKAAESRAEAAAAALLAEEGAAPKGGKAKKAAAPAPSAAELEAASIAVKRADVSLRVATASAAINPEGLRAALELHAAAGSAEVVAEARKMRDRLRERAKKAAKKAKSAEGCSAEAAKPSAAAAGGAGSPEPRAASKPAEALTGDGGRKVASRLGHMNLVDGCD